MGRWLEGTGLAHEEVEEGGIAGEEVVVEEVLGAGVAAEEAGEVVLEAFAVVHVGEVGHFVEDDLVHEGDGEEDDDGEEADVAEGGAVAEVFFEAGVDGDAVGAEARLPLPVVEAQGEDFFGAEDYGIADGLAEPGLERGGGPVGARRVEEVEEALPVMRHDAAGRAEAEDAEAFAGEGAFGLQRMVVDEVPFHVEEGVRRRMSGLMTRGGVSVRFAIFCRRVCRICGWCLGSGFGDRRSGCLFVAPL